MWTCASKLAHNGGLLSELMIAGEPMKLDKMKVMVGLSALLTLGLSACNRAESRCARAEGATQERMDACELGCAKKDEDSCQTLKQLEAELERAHPISGFNADRQGLAKLINELAQKHSGGQRAIARAMARQLKLPAPQDYFTQHYGQPKGALLARELERSPLKLYALPAAIATEQAKGRTEVLTNAIIDAKDDGATYPQQLAIQAYQGQPPLTLYTVRLVRPKDQDGFALWSFIHDGQQFRYIGQQLQIEDYPPEDDSQKAMRQLPMRAVKQMMGEQEKTLEQIMGKGP